MGVESMAFMMVAFVASLMFANGLYMGLLAMPVLHGFMQWLTKKEYYFFRIFIKYLNESDAYSSLPRPEDWRRRPKGWGVGLPW
jgi:hypothetical protein